MRIGVKDIAKLAGVSTATVSHALNKTRYVSPELVKKVVEAADQLGYFVDEKGADSSLIRLGKNSEIACVFPGMNSVLYTKIINIISKKCTDKGFILSTYVSGGKIKNERHILSELISNRRVAGIILCPVMQSSTYYSKLFNTEKPVVFLEREIDEDIADCVIADNVNGIKSGIEHLIGSGHERIALLIEDKDFTTIKERRAGYIAALKEHDLTYNESLILNVPLNRGSESKELIKQFIRSFDPTAILAAGNTLTLHCLKSIEEMGLNCPKNISVVGFGDNEWCELISPALTALTQNYHDIAEKTIEFLIERIENSTNCLPPRKVRVPVDFIVRESTISIACGPFGEKVVYPEDVIISPDEIEMLKNGNYSVAISFHYTGNEWTRLHELAIKHVLSGWGVRVMAVTDANFDADLQNTQLDSLIMQRPDVLIAVPVDETSTSQKFKEISSRTKLILINNVPNNLSNSDYVCWISVNEKENGQAAAKIIQDYFLEKNKVARVGMLIHGTPFFCTKQRDHFAEQIFMNSGPNIEVASKKSFYTIDNTYDTCIEMIKEHPEINALYISWDRPALQAIKALKSLGREDIVISTTDLDYEIASYLSDKKMVIGLSSQRPYEQGVAVAAAAAKALLNHSVPSCIGVPPYTVKPDNLEKAWKEILKNDNTNFGMTK